MYVLRHHIVSTIQDSIKARIDKLRIAARAKLKDVRRAIGGDVSVARAALLKHVEKITFERDGKIFVASGDWKLLGDESATYGWCRGPG
jgi:hypothetical protein